MQRQIDKLTAKTFDLWEHIEQVPTPLEFSTSQLGHPPDPWQKDYLVEALARRRVGIAASRQSGKSTVTGHFAANCLLFVPGFQILVASRSLRQAAHYLSGVRQAVLSVLPRDSLVELNQLSMTLPNGSRIIAIPCAQPDAGRGFSPDLVILDEAAFAPEALFRAITPSLAATDGALHMLSSPNGKQGYFYEAFEGTAEDVFWTRRVPWTDCPRITKETAAMERVALGDLYFRQEFEAEFVSPEGAFFGAEALNALFNETEEMPVGDLGLRELEKQAADVVGLDKPPTRDDLQAALDRADRARRLLYD